MTQRTIILGDLHGCLRQALDLLEKAAYTKNDRVILLGDFVDRGPDSPGCVDFARKHSSVMGNHENKHVLYRKGILKMLSRSQVGARQQFHDRGLDYDAAVDFMETLPLYIELPEAILVHAGLEYGQPMDKQDRIVLIGGMSKRHITGIDPDTGYPYWCATYPARAKPVVWGHLSVTPKIRRPENLFPIDTDCHCGGELTALTLPDFKLYSVPGLR